MKGLKRLVAAILILTLVVTGVDVTAFSKGGSSILATGDNGNAHNEGDAAIGDATDRVGEGGETSEDEEEKEKAEEADSISGDPDKPVDKVNRTTVDNGEPATSKKELKEENPLTKEGDVPTKDTNDDKEEEPVFTLPDYDYDKRIEGDVTITSATAMSNKKVLYTGDVTVAANVTLSSSVMLVEGTLNINSGYLMIQSKSEVYTAKDFRIQSNNGGGEYVIKI